MRTKSNSFYLGLLECDYDVIVLTETWLSAEFNSEEFFPSDFIVFRRDRYKAGTNRFNGGIIIAVRNKFGCEIMFSDETLELLAVKVKIGSTFLIICGVYFPCNSGQSFCNNFLNSFENHVLPSMGVNDDMFILGDFNFPGLAWVYDDEDNLLIPSNTNETSHVICDYMASIGVSQINNVPNSNGAYLDLVFYTNKFNYTLTHCDDVAGHSSIYHTPVSIDLSYETCSNISFVNNNKNRIYNFRKADYNSINCFLSSID